MLSVIIEKQAQKFVAKLPPKQSRQIKTKILELLNNPHPTDSKQLQGFVYKRVDVGEYRIIYNVQQKTLTIPVIGKRNDGEAYKKLKRRLR